MKQEIILQKRCRHFRCGRTCSGIWRVLLCTYNRMIRADTVCRRTAENVFVWNPVVSIADLKEPEMLFQSVLNFGLFWPLGWYFPKRIPVKKALLWELGSPWR